MRPIVTNSTTYSWCLKAVLSDLSLPTIRKFASLAFSEDLMEPKFVNSRFQDSLLAARIT